MEDERQRVEVRKTGKLHCSAPATSHCLMELFVKVQSCELILCQNLEIQCKVYTISTQKRIIIDIMPDHTYVSYWFHSKATGARVEWEAGAYRAFNKHGTGAGELRGGCSRCARDLG